jgi:hypothetical protein
MSRLRAVLAFAYDFVVGDDATIAAAVAATLALTTATASLHVAAWWIVPTSVVAILLRTLVTATRR